MTRTLFPKTAIALTVFSLAVPAAFSEKNENPGPPGPVDVTVTNTPLPVSQTGTADVNITNAAVPVTQTGQVDVIVLSGIHYEFIGFSSTFVQGDVTLGGMHYECQDTFSDPRARMCTVDEFIKSPSITSDPPFTMQGWAHREFVGGYNDGSTSWYVTANGRSQQQDTCNNWTMGTDVWNGQLVEVSSDGARINLLGRCDLTHRVACCSITMP